VGSIALVTGAAGFIGSHLCRRLVGEGYIVRGLDDLSDGALDNLREVPEVDLIEADLCDERAVTRAARGSEIVFHQGAKRSVPRSMLDPTLTTQVNVLGTLNVLLAAREAGARVVSASSSSVYGDQATLPLQEDMEPHPRSPYAASKLAAEAFCGTAEAAFGVRAISLRYFNVYGPGQDPASEYAAVVPRFVMACLEGSRPVIHGDGEQARDFTYVDDAIEANLRAARAPEGAYGVALNIGGGGAPTSVNELLRLIGDLCDERPEPMFEPARPGDVRTTQADLSRAGALIGYHPATTIQMGLRRTVDAFREAVTVLG
jgi:nucleoside-diphosphate-sugar epimerase